jgi:hypothetical protein
MGGLSFLGKGLSDTPTAQAVDVPLMEGAEIPAAFGATVDARLQAIIALPLLL